MHLYVCTLLVVCEFVYVDGACVPYTLKTHSRSNFKQTIIKEMNLKIERKEEERKSSNGMNTGKHVNMLSLYFLFLFRIEKQKIRNWIAKVEKERNENQ